jgi:hypothetical protein
VQTFVYPLVLATEEKDEEGDTDSTSSASSFGAGEVLITLIIILHRICKALSPSIYDPLIDLGFLIVGGLCIGLIIYFTFFPPEQKKPRWRT